MVWHNYWYWFTPIQTKSLQLISSKGGEVYDTRNDFWAFMLLVVNNYSLRAKFFQNQLRIQHHIFSPWHLCNDVGSARVPPTLLALYLRIMLTQNKWRGSTFNFDCSSSFLSCTFLYSVFNHAILVTMICIVLASMKLFAVPSVSTISIQIKASSKLFIRKSEKFWTKLIILSSDNSLGSRPKICHKSGESP